MLKQKRETSSSTIDIMKPGENYVTRMAELLELPVEVILAHCEPRRDATFRPVREEIGGVIEAEPQPARLMTLKAVADVPPAEEVAPSKTDENDLYTQWREASDAAKAELETQLFSALQRHATAVMWKKIPEADKNLARDIASVVMKQLAEFKGESKFSTWVHRIVLNRCNMYLREKEVAKGRFYVSKNPDYDPKLRDPKAKAAFDRVEEAIDLEPLNLWVEKLPKKDYVLLDCMADEMTMAEAAEKLGVSEDAAESHWRRLKARLKKKLLAKADGK